MPDTVTVADCCKRLSKAGWRYEIATKTTRTYRLAGLVIVLHTDAAGAKAGVNEFELRDGRGRIGKWPTLNPALARALALKLTDIGLPVRVAN